jgi:DNA-directed RNA polymerase specialized sigma24 family protein
MSQANAPLPASSSAQLIAIIALLAEAREQDKALIAHRKTEILLSDSGLTVDEIAQVLGKKPNAVRMSISRSRGAATDGEQ